MFKLMLQGYNQSKVIESASIEESRAAYTEALTETFHAHLNGHIYICRWQTWKLFRDNEILPLVGHFSHKEPILYKLSYEEFTKDVADTGYEVSRYDKYGSDLISFGRTGDKCFVAHLSKNINEYVSWDVAYQMYIDFLENMKCIVS